MSLITKHIITAELETVEAIIAMAKIHGLEGTLFFEALQAYSANLLRDLVADSGAGEKE